MSVCDHDIIERAHNRKELREKIAGIIVRKVLQEDYDDLVEGYLDEILMAADEIILLPAYQAVAQTYYDNLAPLSERAELLATVERMRGALEGFVEGIERAPISWETGCCCCGSPVDSHGFGDGHSPVDEGVYFITQLIKDARTALTTGEEK